MRGRLAIVPIVLLSLNSAVAHGHDDMSGMSPPERLGTVSFEISCAPAAKADFNRGVALLHSFWFDESERAFKRAAAADPDCSMAYWGEAMTNFHQILDRPSPSELAAADAALARADTAWEKDAREVLYLRALHRFLDGYKPEEFQAHATRYAEALLALTHKYPRDSEAKIFYALALLAYDPDSDTTLVNPRKAVSILLPLFRKYPNHPGIAHYIIHACDNPQMARLGLDAARHYALIAPSAPHALHMPGHIFARLGLWQDDIRSNLASKAASETMSTGTMHVGAQNRLHAMEFLEYAYLQTGHDDEARAIAVEGTSVKQSEVDPDFASYYPYVEARFQALFAIETGDWKLASMLAPTSDNEAYSNGLILLAHAEAAGHTKDKNAAKAVVQAYKIILASKPKPPAPGTARATMRDEIAAWADFAAGDLDGAVALLKPIADLQAKVGKQEVELPAREMLAEILMLGGKPKDALKQYRLSLSSDPNRFNGLLGAGRAAEALGNRALAGRYYRTLLANCADATGPAISELAHAREVVAQTTNPGH